MSEGASQGRTEAVLALTEQLLSIASPLGDELAIADWVEDWLRAREPHELIRAANSLCVVPRAPDPSRRTLMLVGHLDTVPALSDNPVRCADGRLYGLGASDMKGADAVILDAIERGVREPTRHNLVAVLYSREEGPYAESEMPLIHAAAEPWFAATDLAVCMEPTDGHVELGCLGTCHARVTFTGVRAHSARPWQGENAIHKAAGLLDRLSEWGVREHQFCGLTFRETVSATMVEFRGARNVIPDRFVVNVNYRFAPGLEDQDVRRELDALVAGEAQWELVDFCPAGRVVSDNDLLAELLEAAGQPEVRAKQAWTDVGRLSHLGIDAINWGPGATAQAHQDGEWIRIDAIEHAIRVVANLTRIVPS